jgi:hypothetical protein
VENGQLAEEVSQVEILDVFPLADDVQASRLDEVHRPLLVTGALDRLSRGDVHRLEALRELE